MHCPLLGEGLAHRPEQQGGEDQLAAPWQQRAFPRQVDQLDRGQRAAADPASERDAAAAGSARRRAASRAPAWPSRAPAGSSPRGLAGGQAARVVAESLLVLVGGVVLLVDHDHAELLERGEERGARAHRDRRVAAAQALPLGEALGGPESAVQHRQSVAEARAQAAEDLVGQGDLGNQHQGLPPDAKGVGHRAQVDLGLAASGHAVEQEGLGCGARSPRHRSRGMRLAAPRSR